MQSESTALPRRPRRYLSYDQIALWMEGIGPELRAQNYVGIAGVIRGGIFPSKCAAFATGVPIYFIQYDRITQSASWIGTPPPPGRLLLCEDVAGMGVTLQHCDQFVSITHPDRDILTIVSDELSSMTPRWSMRIEGIQTIFPWERHDQTTSFQSDWSGGGSMGAFRMKPDHDYRLFGVDLDGVLCADLDSSWYEKDLEGCLAFRDELPMLSSAPALSPGNHMVITGRPIQDSERTRAWLDAWGWTAPVHHRDPAIHSADATYIHKGLTADRLGCSDFIESCPEQSVRIARAWPHIRVYWWNGGSPVIVNAAASSGL